MVALAVAALLFGSLTIEILDGELCCRFGIGLIRKRFPLRHVVAVETVRNSWIWGWGIRYTPHGWLFNVSGLDAVELTLVVEPLNPINHRGYFVVTSPDAYEIMKAVGSKHVKILFDIYHQQISEGNLIHNIRKYWDEIAYFQVGDVPGRAEPLTGEINYRNVFKAIYEAGYRDIVACEIDIFPLLTSSLTTSDSRIV